MQNNNIVLLNQILEEAKSTAPSSILMEDKLFEYFSAEQVLKDYELSSDEIFSGITGKSGDGGIDGFYVFADENLVAEDFEPSRLPSKYSLELYILQSKIGMGFTENAIDKLIVSLPILLNLNIEPDPNLYDPTLIQKFEIFRSLFTASARKFPAIKINIIYLSKGSTDNIHSRVKSKADELKEKVESVVGVGSTSEVIFIGARELLNLARKEPSHTLELKYDNSANRTGQSSYVALVPVKSYSEFLTDPSGRLRKFIFESNVRDFQGNTQVNTAIRESLASIDSEKEPDFWWLNNGITILCTEVSITGGKFILKDPQIVNGLQTSVSIFEHFKIAPAGTKDARSLLVRIITLSDDDIRNRVIVATNSQTNLLPSAIRATDILQRDIEQYFFSNGYFYDRRKNYYKNLGKPADLIIAVPYLAQAVLSIGYSEPNNARARPSSLIGEDAEYRRIFNETTPMDGYLWMAKFQRSIDKFIRGTDLGQDFKANMKFHLSMVVTYKLIGNEVYSPNQLKNLFRSELDTSIYLEASNELKKYLAKYTATNPDFTLDRIAKSQDFVSYLKSELL